MPSTRSSSTRAAMRNRRSGSAMPGRCCVRKAGSDRCTGTKTACASSPSAVGASDPHAPACHLSLYEADAFARWAGARLPTEAEWEQAATGIAVDGNFADAGTLHPQAVEDDGSGLQQLFGDVWQWTSSAYTAYPGFRPLPGSLGEYNGKFMSGQNVLRGGSCATPAGHVQIGRAHV